MIGGTIIEIIPLDDVLWVNCRGTGCESNDECAIHVRKTAVARTMIEGDTLWWQDTLALWTPAAEHRDIRLEKVGYSGKPRPILCENSKLTEQRFG